MPPRITLRELGRLRLAAQRLAGPACATAEDAVRWMTATQAQDLPGALTSVALRTASRRREDVEAALDAGTVVRSWPMRGTLHLVAAEDLGWMLTLTTERLLAGAVTRRAQLGLDDAQTERARDVAVGALEGGRRLTRAELLEVWESAGIATTGQRGYHLIWYLAQTGTLCWGPVDGRAQHLVLLDEWVPAPRRLDREEALAEWALRYLRSHGPATLADFVWWTKLLVPEARAGVAAARAHLEVVEVDGTEYLMDPATPDRAAAARTAARGVHLLPGFDEYLLGYGDRGAVLPAEHAERICPGRNGVFQPTVVAAGQVVGTWKRPPSGSGTVVATPFTAFARTVEAALPRAEARLPRT